MAMTEQITPYAAPIVWGDTPAQRIWPGDRRAPQQFATRAALVRLRMAEFKAADHLPPDLMQEFTAAIDRVVDIIRGQP